MFGMFKAGLVPVNTNYRYGDDELVYLWTNADVVAVVFHGTVRADHRAHPRPGARRPGLDLCGRRQRRGPRLGDRRTRRPRRRAGTPGASAVGPQR